MATPSIFGHATDPFGLKSGSKATPSWSSWADQIDPGKERESLWQSFTPIFAYQQSFGQNGSSYDPPTHGEPYDPISSLVGSSQLFAQLDEFQMAHPPEWAKLARGADIASRGIGQANPTSPAAALNEFDSAFGQASAKYGVPANLLKAVAIMEEGYLDNESDAGALGIMQIMPNFWGQEAIEQGYPDWSTDPTQNILMGAYILNQMNQGDPTWEKGVRSYLGGDDPYTGVTNDQYWTNIKTYWDQLNEGGQAQLTGGWEGNFDKMFGAGASDVQDWGEFNVPSENGLYGYGIEYGLNGVNHTGIDIMRPVNSPMMAGFSGHVVCSGTGNGTGEDSCSAFNYVPNFDGAPQQSGAGRIEIVSDDGNTILIYGHSLSSAVRPGQQVNPGDLLGYSGGQNSGHIHLEARIRDPNTNSGWRIVDPREVLGAMSLPAAGTHAPIGLGSGSLGQAIWDKVAGVPGIWKGPDPSSDFGQWIMHTLKRETMQPEEGAL